MDIASAVIIAIVAAIIGFILGSIKFFREEKQRAYRELLPPIVRMAYHREIADEKEFNQAVLKVWLYANKNVAKKMNKAVSIIIKPERGDKTKTLQEAIVAMRNDIQPWSFKRLKPEEVEHIYAQLVKYK